MRTEQVHTLILGAGPSGLAAGYVLAKAGLKPVLLEKDKVSGGLIRSFHRGDFIVDIGRKELYNRLLRVDEFWKELLGDDYRTYAHRGGILYDGHIVDMSPAYVGARRGMPWSMFLGCGLDFIWWRLRSTVAKPKNLEEYWYLHRGRFLTRVANQGFQEKLAGKRWADVPMPESVKSDGSHGLLRTIGQAFVRGFSSKENNTATGLWRHPAKGTGQICESLERGIREFGGRIENGAKVLEIQASQGTIRSVKAEIGGETVVFEPSFLMSSTPAEFMQQLLFPGRSPSQDPNKKPATPKRVVILVYLFLNEEPKFPHFWLQVTCPKTKAGRIANYAALNSDMVPKGKTAICCEYYCFGDDPLLKLDDAQMTELCLRECHEAGIIDRSKCFDTMSLRFPGADASQNRHNWFSKERQLIYAEQRQFENLYSINRTDIDIATLAGIEGAEAILSGKRDTFDLHFSPDELDIKSAPKPFEFRNPAGIQF